jgi:hypothetical protein
MTLLSVTLRFDAQSAGAGMLAPLFDSVFFRPVALGGIEMSRGGDHWLLAGSALESFVAQFAAKEGARPESVRSLAEASSDVARYHAALEAFIRARRAPDTECAPFESVSGALTWYHGPALERSALWGADRWLEEFSRASVHVYGSVSPALSAPRSASGEPLRIVFPSESTHLGAPLLRVGLELSPPNGRGFELRLLSEAPIWMRGAGQASGLVSQSDADWNLAQFGELTRSLLEVAPSSPTWCGLVLDDRTLADEVHRFLEKLPTGIEVC